MAKGGGRGAEKGRKKMKQNIILCGGYDFGEYISVEATQHDQRIVALTFYLSKRNACPP